MATIDPIEDPDVRARLANLKPQDYPVNYVFLNLLKDRMEEPGSPYRDDMIAIPKFPLTCSTCQAQVVPQNHHRASFACPESCGWFYVRRDAAA